MPVVFLIAVLAILVGVFFAATGRGGELAVEHADHAPLDLGPVSAADVALLRPPTALWGYNTQVTDEALDHIARAMRDRDVTIARLRQQLANFDPVALAARQVGAPATQSDARRARAVSGDANAPQPVADPSEADDTQILGFLRPPGILVASRAHEATQPRDAAQSSEATQPRDATQSSEATQPAESIQAAEPTQPAEPIQPREASQPPALAQPAEAITQPREVAQPAEALAAPPDVQGPQGFYDTYDWWAEQKVAARDEARHQADAQKADAPEVSAPEASAPEASAPEAGQPASEPAGPAEAAPGQTATQPNPALASPDDQTLSATEEQAW